MSILHYIEVFKLYYYKGFRIYKIKEYKIKTEVSTDVHIRFLSAKEIFSSNSLRLFLYFGRFL